MIDRFPAPEIVIGNASDGNTIAGNFIGTDPTGTSSASTGDGIEGNLIGTDATGTVPLPGIAEGVHLCNGSGCAGNRIGGAAVAPAT